VSKRIDRLVAAAEQDSKNAARQAETDKREAAARAFKAEQARKAEQGDDSK
jgi:hypothetical protein